MKIIGILIIALCYICTSGFGTDFSDFSDEQRSAYCKAFHELESIKKILPINPSVKYDIPNEKYCDLIKKLKENPNFETDQNITLSDIYNFFNTTFNEIFVDELNTQSAKIKILTMLKNSSNNLTDIWIPFINILNDYFSYYREAIVDNQEIRTPLDNPQLSILLLEYFISQQRNVEPYIKQIIELCHNADLNQDELTDFCDFYIQHISFFNEISINGITNYIITSLPLTDTSDPNLALKAILFIKNLVKHFPYVSGALDQNQILEILLGKTGTDSSIRFTAKTFNQVYTSENIFELLSKRIIYILIQNLFLIQNLSAIPTMDVTYLSNIFLWMGLSRAFIDLISSKSTLTEFGKLVDLENRNTVYELWNELSINRLFSAMLFDNREINIDNAINIAREQVAHLPADYYREFPKEHFLCFFKEALLKKDSWQDDLFRFIVRFAISSTFYRGQGAIMEWCYTIVTNIHKTQFEYNFPDIKMNTTLFRFITQKFKTLSSNLNTFQNVYDYIKELIPTNVTILTSELIERYLTRLFTHMDVIALHLSFQQEPFSFRDLENKFLEIVGQLGNFSSFETELDTVCEIEEEGNRQVKKGV